ncbi:MAG: 3-phosphoserine/phosphohydroxythreonine transaminase [Spirochaetota bacterium]
MNFSAGPSVLPVEVLQKLEAQIADHEGNGYSMIEASHRGPMFNGMYQECLGLFRELLGIPENYKLFFLGGGATLQFGMIPMNFLHKGQRAAYIKSGAWANKACTDAQNLGEVDVLFDGKDSGYSTLPDPAEVRPAADAAYLHLCSNETIGGIEWQGWPETGDVPLIADMSSDIFSRPVPVEKFAMIYGGVQKNLGPAGATFVILRDDMFSRSPDWLPAYLNYNTHAKDGLYNTPPVFSIWAVKLVLEWIQANGGVEGMAERAKRKSDKLYKAIDQSGGFYRSPVDARYRSKMNVVFRLKSEELEKQFIQQAGELGMLGLKGHRSVGGCRASIYNALPEEHVTALTEFMGTFAKENS